MLVASNKSFKKLTDWTLVHKNLGTPVCLMTESLKLWIFFSETSKLSSSDRGVSHDGGNVGVVDDTANCLKFAGYLTQGKLP